MKRSAPASAEKRRAAGGARGEGSRVRTIGKVPQEIRALREALGPAP